MISVLGAASFTFLVTAVLTFFLTRSLSQKFKELGITGLDVHKPTKPVTAEMGGLAILVGVALGAALFYLLEPTFPFVYLAALLTVLLVGIVGIVDDMVTLRQRYKPFIVGAMSIPLMIALFGQTAIRFPLVGSIPFGLLYPLFVVPLGKRRGKLARAGRRGQPQELRPRVWQGRTSPLSPAL